MQRLAPLINEGGAVLFTTSIADNMGCPGITVYGGANAALRTFAKGFAAELMPRGVRGAGRTGYRGEPHGCGGEPSGARGSPAG